MVEPVNGMSLFEVIAPAENDRDAAGVENMLATLPSGPLSLEIAGHATQRRLLVRGREDTVLAVLDRLAAAYPQAQFRRLRVKVSEEDPAIIQRGEVVHSAELYLAQPPYLPIKIFESHRDRSRQGADPLLDLLGAVGGAGPGRSLVQLILEPAPFDWSKHYLPIARSRDWRERSMTAPAQLRIGVFLSMVFWGLVSFLVGLFAWLDGDWLKTVASWSALFGGEGMLWFLLQRLDIQGDPDLMRAKTYKPAYRVWIRASSMAADPLEAESRLRAVTRAFEVFNLPGGNGFRSRPIIIDPASLTTDLLSWQIPLTGDGFRPPWLAKPILNVAELASLWHLPLGEMEVQSLKRSQAKRFLPAVETPDDGILVGVSEHQGRKVEVRLPRELLNSNLFLVGKTQRGKSTLMMRLAEAVMAQRDRALVVFDPHTDLVRAILTRVPEDRIQDVVLLDLADHDFPVGINLLEVRPESPREPGKIVSDIIASFSDIWERTWGPRMESFLRWVLVALVGYNRVASRQATILEVNLFLNSETYQLEVLRMLPDPDVHRWWRDEFQALRHQHQRFLIEVISPIKTKIDAFIAMPVVRNILGQPLSTVHLEDEVKAGRIVLVNLASGIIGNDAASLIGSALLDHLAAIFATQAEKPRDERFKATVIVDEMQTIGGAAKKYEHFLQELSKYGANVILGTQSLGLLDGEDTTLRDSIFANTGGLFTFETSAADAQYLVKELDERVGITDLINLGPFRCYLKTLHGGERAPVVSMETLPPDPGDDLRAEMARDFSRQGFARPRVEVEAERKISIQDVYYPLPPSAQEAGQRPPLDKEVSAALQVLVPAGEDSKQPLHKGAAPPPTEEELAQKERNRSRRQRGKKKEPVDVITEKPGSGDTVLAHEVPADERPSS